MFERFVSDRPEIEIGQAHRADVLHLVIPGQHSNGINALAIDVGGLQA